MINIKNIDGNECFKWCLVRYLNPADHHPARITKTDTDFAETLDFKYIKFPVKVRDIHIFVVIVFQPFSTEQISKCHIKDYFKINGKQRIIMPRKREYVKFK